MELIRRFKDVLCRDIPPHHCRSIAQMLKRNGTITEDDYERVYHSADVDRSRVLVELVLRSNTHQCYASFSTALKENELNHLVEKIEGTSKPETESEVRHKRFINIFYSEIVKKLSARDVLTHFPHVLDEHTRQKVLAETSAISQAGALLHYALKNNESVRRLIIALKSGDCGSCDQLVDLMQGNEKFNEFEVKENIKLLARLCTHSKRIHRDLEPMDLRNQLTIMDGHQWSDIEHCSTREDRVNTFLSFLGDKNSPWFKDFIAALGACGKDSYSELATVLEESHSENDQTTQEDYEQMEEEVWETVVGDASRNVQAVPMSVEKQLDLEQQAIDEIRREAEIDARDDKLSSGQCPDVNPTMREIDVYRGVHTEEVKQLRASSKPGYASQLGGKQISYNDLTSMISDGRGQFISLSGNPGSGKTTLSKKLVLQLQKNKKNLVLHLSFMYLNYGDNKLTLQELLLDNQFPNVSPSTCGVAFQWIVKNQVCCYLVFDGLDQATWSLENVQPVKRKYDTPMLVQQLVANLCSKMFLGKSSLIFTSRPHSLLSLPLKLRPKTTISVQNFSTHDMKALFDFYAGEKANKLWKKLETKSPQILDFCHNPMLLQFVVYAGLHEKADHMKTITNIFDVVLEQLGNSEYTQGYDIDTLKRPLGKMAYKGMLNKSVVFRSEYLKEVGLEDVNVQEVVIKVARYSCLQGRKVFKGAQVLFYFSHQTLQEIFAAYYICLFMPLQEFQQVVNEVVKGGHWLMVRRFMGGILLGNDADFPNKEEDLSSYGLELSSEASTSLLQQADVAEPQVTEARGMGMYEVSHNRQKFSCSVDMTPSEATTSHDSNQRAKVRYEVMREIPNRSWNEFARKKLNLPDDDIDNIEVDYKNDIQEQKYQMILHWERMNGENATDQSLLQLCEEFKTQGNISSTEPTMSTLQEKRKIFLKQLATHLSSVCDEFLSERIELPELLVDFQECCEEAKKHLARFCPRVLYFSAIPLSMTLCHALVDFLPRIKRTDVELWLRSCDLDHDKLQQIYNGMKNMKVKLEVLSLRSNPEIGKNGVEIISGIFTKVRKLRLGSCRFDSESIRILKEVLSKLEDPPEVQGLSEEEQRNVIIFRGPISSSSDWD